MSLKVLQILSHYNLVVKVSYGDTRSLPGDSLHVHNTSLASDYNHLKIPPVL